MSSLKVDTAQIIATSASILIDNYCGMAAFALIVHEYIITFPHEVELFWKSRMHGASVLFLLNRYIVLLTLVVSVLGVFVSFPPSRYIDIPLHSATTNPLMSTSCSATVVTSNVLAIMQYVPWAAFAGLRTYAISTNKALAILILVLSLVPVGADSAHFVYGLYGVEDPLFGCVVVNNIRPDLSHNLTILSRVCLIASDAIVIAITWATLGASNDLIATAAPRRSIQSSFSMILLRNGTLYFVILLFLNVLHLVLTLESVSAAFQAASYVIQFIHPITGILVSRFLLDLQFASRQSLGIEHPSCTSWSGTQSLTSTDVFGHNTTLLFQDSLPSPSAPSTPPGESMSMDELEPVLVIGRAWDSAYGGV